MFSPQAPSTEASHELLIHLSYPLINQGLGNHQALSENPPTSICSGFWNLNLPCLLLLLAPVRPDQPHLQTGKQRNGLKGGAGHPGRGSPEGMAWGWWGRQQCYSSDGTERRLQACSASAQTLVPQSPRTWQEHTAVHFNRPQTGQAPQAPRAPKPYLILTTTCLKPSIAHTSGLLGPSWFAFLKPSARSWQGHTDWLSKSWVQKGPGHRDRAGRGGSPSLARSLGGAVLTSGTQMPSTLQTPHPPILTARCCERWWLRVLTCPPPQSSCLTWQVTPPPRPGVVRGQGVAERACQRQPLHPRQEGSGIQPALELPVGSADPSRDCTPAWLHPPPSPPLLSLLPSLNNSCSANQRDRAPCRKRLKTPLIHPFSRGRVSAGSAQADFPGSQEPEGTLHTCCLATPAPPRQECDPPSLGHPAPRTGKAPGDLLLQHKRTLQSHPGQAEWRHGTEGPRIRSCSQ